MKQLSNLNRVLLIMSGWILSAAIASAQDVSFPISQPLTSGINSSIAPAGSPEIEPGTGNLLSPDQRIVGADPIGADIVGTGMSPAITSTILGSPDIDINALQNTTGTQATRKLAILNSRIAGASPTQSINTSLVSGFSPASVQAPASTFASKPLSLAAPQQQIYGTTNNPVGGAASPARNRIPDNQPRTLSGETSNPVPNLVQGSATDTSTGSSKPASYGLQQSSSTGYSRNPQKFTRRVISNEDSNSQWKNPLENQRTLTDEDQDFTVIGVSPFKDLSTTTFLNPDIFRTGFQSSSTGMSNTSRMKQPKLGLRNTHSYAGLNQAQTDALSQMNVSRSEQKLLRREYKQEYEGYKRKRDAWHNPLLQQMEVGETIDKNR